MTKKKIILSKKGTPRLYASVCTFDVFFHVIMCEIFFGADAILFCEFKRKNLLHSAVGGDTKRKSN